MGGRFEQRAGPAAWAAYLAVRGAMALPAAAGIGPSLAAARVVGRGFGRLPQNRGRVERASSTLEVAMPHLDAPARRELVLKSYEHLAMLAVEVASLPRMMTPRRWADHIEIAEMMGSVDVFLRREPLVLITGHAGNWEILGASMGVLGFPMHTVYRPLDLAPLDRWLRRTRAATGLSLIDKFGAASRLPGLIQRLEPVGFVADQNAGDRGLFVPFFNRLASSYKTIALLALEAGATVVCSVAYRTAPGDRPAPGSFPPPAEGTGAQRYRIRVFDVFGPDDYLPQPDPVFYITARYRRAIEAMVRTVPEQYLWMHRAWKSRPLHERTGKPFPPRLREKLAALPWMSDAEVEAIVERSARDAALLAELGTDRLP